MISYEKINDYIHNGHARFKGWLLQIDAILIAVTALLQAETKYHGNMLEIGVYHGKSLKILHLLAQKDEVVHG